MQACTLGWSDLALFSIFETYCTHYCQSGIRVCLEVLFQNIGNFVRVLASQVQQSFHIHIYIKSQGLKILLFLFLFAETFILQYIKEQSQKNNF